ncbi:MAG TPA: GNAT family N-acetyltransferase [Ktedonobacteraceae bacterium]|jgi:GNAT superfamily N-acetyltransferase
MLTIDRQPALPAGWQGAVTHLPHGALQVTLSLQETSFTLRLVPNRATGIRLEEFAPEIVDPAVLERFSHALQAFLTPLDWQYAIALYPVLWRSAFANLGFEHLSERVRLQLLPGSDTLQEPVLPENVSIGPLTASAQDLGRLLLAAEHDPCLPLARCTALCQELLDGAYGPLIARGCGELSVGNVPVGACIFTNYFAEPLVGHIFLEHSMQGRGYARMLLQHCLAGIRGEGFTRAVASTDVANIASLRLHITAGFTRVHPNLSCSLLMRANWKRGEA